MYDNGYRICDVFKSHLRIVGLTSHIEAVVFGVCDVIQDTDAFVFLLNQFL